MRLYHAILVLSASLVAPNSGLEETQGLAERLRRAVGGVRVAVPGGELAVTISAGRPPTTPELPAMTFTAPRRQAGRPPARARANRHRVRPGKASRGLSTRGRQSTGARTDRDQVTAHPASGGPARQGGHGPLSGQAEGAKPGGGLA